MFPPIKEKQTLKSANEEARNTLFSRELSKLNSQRRSQISKQQYKTTIPEQPQYIDEEDLVQAEEFNPQTNPSFNVKSRNQVLYKFKPSFKVFDTMMSP